jgi:hypothetical protein
MNHALINLSLNVSRRKYVSIHLHLCDIDSVCSGYGEDHHVVGSYPNQLQPRDARRPRGSQQQESPAAQVRQHFPYCPTTASTIEDLRDSSSCTDLSPFSVVRRNSPFKQTWDNESFDLAWSEPTGPGSCDRKRPR